MREPIFLPHIILYFSSAIPYLSIILIFLVLSLLPYLLYIFIKRYLERHKKLFFLLVRFPNPAIEQEKLFQDSMFGFFSSIHNLSINSKFSFEVLKENNSLNLVISTISLNTLNSIKSLLTKIEDISIEELSSDPINSILNFKYRKRLVLKKNFYTINLNQAQFFNTLINSLSSLEEGDKAGVMFICRGIDRLHQIDNALNKRKNILNKEHILL